MIGAALYLTVVGLFGLGLGAIVRNTAGGIATFAGIMFVLPPLMNVLPASWNNAASPYLPLAAGQAIMSITPGNHLRPGSGFALSLRLRSRCARESRRSCSSAATPSRRSPLPAPAFGALCRPEPQNEPDHEGGKAEEGAHGENDQVARHGVGEGSTASGAPRPPNSDTSTGAGEDQGEA